MTLPKPLIDREKAAFEEVNSKVAKRVKVENNVTLTTISSQLNSIEPQKTTVTNTATRITTPESTGEFFITNHTVSEIVYLGGAGVTTATGFPLDKGELITLTDMQSADGNEIYGITSSGSATIYAVGVVAI